MDEDAGLVESAKAGDYAAFEALVGKYECRMFGLAVGILQRCEVAEDAVQRTFLSVVEHLKDFRGEAAFRTWLTRIATNHALEILRKRRGLSTVPFEESPSGEDETRPPFPEFVASWRENPERLASRAETGRLLQEALAAILSLPPNLVLTARSSCSVTSRGCRSPRPRPPLGSRRATSRSGCCGRGSSSGRS